MLAQMRSDVVVTRIFAAMALAAAMLPAAADEAAVRRMIQEKLRGGGQLESVQKMPWGNLYEVTVRAPDGVLLYYVDEEAKVVIAGQVIDAKTGRNLTEERQRELSKVSWESLPLQWAITSKRGTGRRKIAILSDPNCPYCKRFEEDLAKLDDVTVHILPYPVISPKSVRQAKAVWCSKDRVKAWNDLMFKRIEPQASPDCDTPVEKIVEAGRRLGASATPTWFVETGERYSGAMPLDELTRVLEKASPKR
jgi:thiol:disulfide interchange protein DsbC